jgi:hypothetical protein
MKNIYEILDELDEAKTKQERLEVLRKNYNKALEEVLVITFHPNAQWLIKEMPASYKVPDTLPGVAYSSIGSELRRFYLFKKGDPRAEALDPKRREEILIQILESLEPREAEVIIGIFQKNLGVKGLTYKFIKEAIPNIPLP